MAIEEFAEFHAELEREMLRAFAIPAHMLNQQPEKQTFHQLQQRLKPHEEEPDDSCLHCGGDGRLFGYTCEACAGSGKNPVPQED